MKDEQLNDWKKEEKWWNKKWATKWGNFFTIFYISHWNRSQFDILISSFCFESRCHEREAASLWCLHRSTHNSHENKKISSFSFFQLVILSVHKHLTSQFPQCTQQCHDNNVKIRQVHVKVIQRAPHLGHQKITISFHNSLLSDWETETFPG